MRSRSTSALTLTIALLLSQLPLSTAAAKGAQLVEFEKMTWVEVKDALAAGKTTALIYTGGVEQRGPQNANGGHNLMAYATVKAIAEKLGNAIFMPVLPFTPNNANAELPGTIGITNDLLAAILERITEQSITNGFKNVILMGDHGGGQPEVYQDVATKLDGKYSARRASTCTTATRCTTPANDAFESTWRTNGYPPDLHGGISDTAEMMYLDKDNTWVRKNLPADRGGRPCGRR